MSNQNEPNESSKDVRLMWISVAVIVLIIVGGMGINMLVHHDTSAGTVEAGNPPQ
jgi:flagellar basal body-associated protein FliL